MNTRLVQVLAVVAAVVFSVSGCGKFSEAEQFKLVPAPSGELYRIQGATGTVHKVLGTSLVRISELDRVQLQAGAVYIFENGSSMKYVGEGKFEPFKSDVLTLDEYLKGQSGKK